jgi:transcription initiation factor TFIID subunit TAF12
VSDGGGEGINSIAAFGSSSELLQASAGDAMDAAGAAAADAAVVDAAAVAMEVDGAAAACHEPPQQQQQQQQSSEQQQEAQQQPEQQQQQSPQQDKQLQQVDPKRQRSRHWQGPYLTASAAAGVPDDVPFDAQEVLQGRVCCPSHYCQSCHLSGDSLKLLRCWTCPRAYHTS